MPPRRALFVVLSMRIGGAERVTATLLQRLAQHTRTELHLALIDSDGELRGELPPSVTLHSIGTRNPLACLRRLRSLIRDLQPDVVFSTMFPVNVAVSLLKPAFPSHTRLVLREVNVLQALTAGRLRGRILKRVAARTFAHADAIVCQSDFMRDDLCNGLRLDRSRLHTIFNPVNFERIQSLAGEMNPYLGAGPGPHVLAVGRLLPKKGFDRLLDAAPALLARRPDAQFWILGQGPEREPLLQQAHALGISDHVHLVGQAANPYCWMRHADLFVLPSRHEGTPNALLEAIACRSPVVVLDHPGGTREVMEQTGQLNRMVTCLARWQQDWFAPPPAEVLRSARRLLDPDRITRQYLQVLTGERRAA